MYILYLDELGVPEAHPSQTSHYVLLGMAVYVGSWFWLDRRIREVKGEYALGPLETFELHAAWIRRPYPEQQKVPDFEELGWQARRDAVLAERERIRHEEFPGLPGSKRRNWERSFRYTDPYVHLTLSEREDLIDDALQVVEQAGRRIVLFAEGINKEGLPPTVRPIDQAFTQVVTRFNHFLNRRREDTWGLLAIDHDEHKANRLANMLSRFQREGSPWGTVNKVIEAPFFFESESSAGVQVTDLCAYAVRRYFENGETARFNRVFPKFDRGTRRLHGIRHYTARGCPCIVCDERGHR